jgi:hypothetical protein
MPQDPEPIPLWWIALALAACLLIWGHILLPLWA